MRVVGVAAVLVALVGCGNSSSKGSTAATTTKRPSTTAKLQILQPTPNQVTGTSVTVQVNLIGATIVPATNVGTPKSGNEGHIHLSVDGKIVQMAYQSTYQLTGLTPGQHNLSAEFVATDHLPFANRVIAAVLFTVQG